MSDRPLLMIPGPIEISPAVCEAAGGPPPGHLSPAIMEAFGRALAAMRQVWRASADSQPFILPGSGTLAMESAVILRLARKLARRLRRGDPIAGRVALSKLDFARAGAAGMLAGWLRR